MTIAHSARRTGRAEAQRRPAQPFKSSGSFDAMRRRGTLLAILALAFWKLLIASALLALLALFHLGSPAVDARDPATGDVAAHRKSAG